MRARSSVGSGSPARVLACMLAAWGVGGAALADGLSFGLDEPAVIAPAGVDPDAPGRGGLALGFTLRGGIATAPEYFGAGSNEFKPDIGLSFSYLRLWGGREFGSQDFDAPRTGFGLRGSFRYVDSRDAADHPELAGLNDVDSSVELGLGVGYTGPWFKAYADLRYGVIGHESFVAEIGADAIYAASDRLTLRAGPRILWGSSDYNATYFGVTPAESAASGGAFAPFQAGSGLVSAGVELGVEYRINDRWGIEGAVTWDRLMDDAEDSPITVQGDRDQFGARLGVTRRVSFGF